MLHRWPVWHGTVARIERAFTLYKVLRVSYTRAECIWWDNGKITDAKARVTHADENNRASGHCHFTRETLHAQSDPLLSHMRPPLK